MPMAGCGLKFDFNTTTKAQNHREFSGALLGFSEFKWLSRGVVQAKMEGKETFAF